MATRIDDLEKPAKDAAKRMAAMNGTLKLALSAGITLLDKSSFEIQKAAVLVASGEDDRALDKLLGQTDDKDFSLSVQSIVDARLVQLGIVSQKHIQTHKLAKIG